MSAPRLPRKGNAATVARGLFAHDDTEVTESHEDLGFLCNCSGWKPGHECAESREPTNAPTSAKDELQ